MSKIKVLPKSVYSKIAAGEVIDRPASIIRELLDNSIDAGASKIVVKIEKGGLKKVIVSDDGNGIAKDDLPLALSMHATSKISDIDDLLTLETMGFRGEALYSIQAVSKITITSNTDPSGQSAGFTLSNYGPKKDTVVPIAHKRGTKIEVEDIFHNLPARKKFLKSHISEWNAIKKIVVAKAFSNVDIAFELYHNNSLTFSSRGDNDFKTTFFSIYKNEHSFEINRYQKKIDDDLALELYYTTADVFFHNRNYQVLYVNNRPVTLSFFYSAIDNGIREYISPGRHPVIFLYLTIDPKLIDINIHPAKKEIKFYDQNAIFGAIVATIKEAMSVTIRREIMYTDEIGAMPVPGFDDVPQEKQKEIAYDFQEESKPLVVADKSASYFEEVVKGGSKEPMMKRPVPTSEKKSPTTVNTLPRGTNKVVQPVLDVNDIDDKEDYHILGVAFNTYIIVQKGETLIMIDQHAANEISIFQRRKAKYEETKSVEKLLIPIIFDLDKVSVDLDKRLEILQQNNIIVEKDEGLSVKIKELPSILVNRKNYDFIVEAIKRFLEEISYTEDIVDRILIEMSCKQAVKKGDPLTLIEVAEIVSEYFRLGITNCPHGRPAHFEMSHDHLMKIFQRKK